MMLPLAPVLIWLAMHRPQTARTVTRRWREYFPTGVEMGDAEAAHLDRA